MSTHAPIELAAGQEQVLAAFRAHGPMTDQVLVDRSGISMQTASPCRRKLADFGLLEVVGEAPTRSGRKAKFWPWFPTIALRRFANGIASDGHAANR